MSQYNILVPSDFAGTIDDETYIKYFTVDSEVIKNTEIIDTSYNPLIIKNLGEDLHSLLKNDFYLPLMNVLTDELQQFLEYCYVHEKMWDTDIYFGDQEEFVERVSNILNILNLNPPMEFLEYLIENYYESDFSPITYITDTLNIKNKWLKDILKNSFLVKKWAGSIQAYNYIFSSMYRNGSTSIRSKYVNVGVFTAFTNKYFKITEFFGSDEFFIKSSMSRLLPDSSNSKWPLSINIRGIYDYFYLANIQYYKYDTGKTYDEGLGTEDILKYDTGVSFGAEDKGLILDITADKVMTHKNSLNLNECLIDAPWLNYIKSFSLLAKKVTDPIMIGTQISLVASNSGQYITNPLVQILEDEYYTHPNIKAKFQIIKTNWNENFNISKIKIGTGSYDDGVSNVFADHTQNPDLITIPSDISQPLFETAIGQYEINPIGDYLAVTTMIHKTSFINENLVNQLFTFSQSQVLDEDVVTTTIQFPHKSITPGSCSFKIELNFTLEDATVVKRTIILQETFDNELNNYIVSPIILNEFDVKIQNEYFDSPIDFLVDSEMSSDMEYIPSKRDNLLTLIPLEDLLGKSIFCKIDHVNGTLSLKLKIDPLSKIGSIDPYVGNNTLEINGNIVCSYDTNSIRSINSSAIKDTSSIIGITEVGIFNTLGKMIAYGVFPPIIYDAEKYHLTFNCLLQKPVI